MFTRGTQLKVQDMRTTYLQVDYTLLRQHDRNVLRILPVEKAWGPDYLRFGLNLEATKEAGSSFNLVRFYVVTGNGADATLMAVAARLPHAAGARQALFADDATIEVVAAGDAEPAFAATLCEEIVKPFDDRLAAFVAE